MAGLDDIAREAQISNRMLTQINETLRGLFPRVTGSFTCANAATTTVTQPAVEATSIILLMPKNAAAGTLQGSAKHLYISARTAGASFTVATASAASAAGTETFDYILFSAV